MTKAQPIRKKRTHLACSEVVKKNTSVRKDETKQKGKKGTYRTFERRKRRTAALSTGVVSGWSAVTLPQTAPTLFLTPQQLKSRFRGQITRI